jgi:hypothetical protein
VSAEPEQAPQGAPEGAADGTMPAVGPALDNLVSALDGLASLGWKPNRATRRAMKRANRKKGK